MSVGNTSQRALELEKSLRRQSERLHEDTSSLATLRTLASAFLSPLRGFYALLWTFVYSRVLNIGLSSWKTRHVKLRRSRKVAPHSIILRLHAYAAPSYGDGYVRFLSEAWVEGLDRLGGSVLSLLRASVVDRIKSCRLRT